jgi:tRNA-uridine 2-sulfurtransferase
MKKNKIKRVVVAMSGGVDSSVAAYILKKQGYDLVGMSMQVWNYSKSCDTDFGSCCSPDDIYDARRVADDLGIPFYTINLEREFKKDVIDYFAREYSDGRTPNPCIVCNTRLKFHYLLGRAKEIGAEFVATGHYARIRNDRSGYSLLKGIDEKKDQSYFLFSLNQDQLSHILFPIGDFTKNDIRRIAKEAGLKTAMKKESQEICFVPDSDYSSFLKEYYPDQLSGEGKFIDLQGKELGRHAGVHKYTIGQRRGLGISYTEPLYVVKIDKKRNEVVLGNNKSLLKQECLISNLNWISGVPAKSKGLTVKIRYKSQEVKASVSYLENDAARIEFIKPQRAITPGQAAVIYKKDKVLGGGWIR